MKIRIARRWALGIVLGCAAFGAHAQVVVSQIYGGGGESGATLRSDFIELHNNGDAPVNLSGWSVQYASGTGNFWQVTPLSGSIAPGGYYLVKQADGAGGTANLPAPDATGTVVMTAGAGKVALVGNTTAFTTSCPTNAVDFVPYGFGTNCAFTTTSPSATRAVRRYNGGCDDSFNSGADFEAVPPGPRNRASTPFVCSVSSRPPEITITDVGGIEGNSGTVSFAFTVNLSRPARENGVRFVFQTEGATATQGLDFQGQAGQIDLPFTATSARIFISIMGDMDAEPDETFRVRIDPASVRGATLVDGVGLGTIFDDDIASPTISISDTAVAEGDSGTRELIFSVSLSATATRPVTMEYATAGGSAESGSDYEGEFGTLTIPAGNNSVTFGVAVEGDTEVEEDETVVVYLTEPVNATFSDQEGIGTIENDDVEITPIHDIQGIGHTAQFLGQTINTRGIVTARKPDGFYLQTPENGYDNRPGSSEGIFVSTSGPVPEQAAVGNEVVVTGTVAEFRESDDRETLTALTSASVRLVSTGNVLPTPVALTTTFPDPAGPLDQLERVEGMRVTAASLTVVAATGGDVDEPTATSVSDGRFGVVVTDVARPFREPGIRAPDIAPSGGEIPPIPRWDANPELLVVDSDALGEAGTGLDVSVGAILAYPIGVLHYSGRRFVIDAEITDYTSGPAPSAARRPAASEFTYATYNLDRFFDAADDGTIDEPVLTPAAFEVRLGKASLGIRDFLHSPDILGVAEVENLAALQALADRISADAIAGMQPDPRYVAYLEEGNGVDGLDVGFLVKTAEISPGVARIRMRDVRQIGKNEEWTPPGGGGGWLYDRPPLQLDADVLFPDGRAFPVTLIQVQQQSLDGAGTDDVNGLRVRTRRQLQAEYLATRIDRMQDLDPAHHIAVGGDFNAFEFNDGLVDVMGVVTGMPAQDSRTALRGDGYDLIDEDLLNLTMEIPEEQRYSSLVGGNAAALDHILVNQALAAGVASVGLDHARINADFPDSSRGDATAATRLSKRDPVIAYLSAQAPDLSISARSVFSSVMPGRTLAFHADVHNRGPGASLYPSVGFAFDAELPDLTIDAIPSQWTCDVPVVGDGVTEVACSAPFLLDGGIAFFLIVAGTPLEEAGNTITMSASVDAQTFDPELSNDNDSATATVLGGGLTLSVDGPATIPATQGAVDYRFRLRNNADVAAGEPRLVITGNTLSVTAAIVPQAGWRCGKRKVSGSQSWTITCATASLASGETAEFALQAGAKPTPADNTIRVRGIVTSYMDGDAPQDNNVMFSTGIE